MAWPTSTEYQQAVQNPATAFTDLELKAAKPAKSRLTGLPLSWSGNFAVVFRLETARGDVAVRCFTHNLPDQQERYETLTKYLTSGNATPALEEFHYQPQGMAVGNEQYPVIKMPWLKGQQLDEFVYERLNDPGAILHLALRWLEATRELQGNGIAHNDLQHGNVIVQGEGNRARVRLIDYDGMFVPAFRGQASPELGHRHYQHPMRTASDYGEETDNFAALVIYTSLLALAHDRGIASLRSSEESLLFTQADFRNPGRSDLFNELLGTADPAVRQATEALSAAAMGPVAAVPNLQKVATARPSAVPRGPAAASATGINAPQMPAWLRQTPAGTQGPLPQASQATGATPSKQERARRNRNRIEEQLERVADELGAKVSSYARQAARERTWFPDMMPVKNQDEVRSLRDIENTRNPEILMTVLDGILDAKGESAFRISGLSKQLLRDAREINAAWAKWRADFSDDRYTEKAADTLERLCQTARRLPDTLPPGGRRISQRQGNQAQGQPGSGRGRFRQQLAKFMTKVYAKTIVAASVILALTMALSIAGAMSAGTTAGIAFAAAASGAGAAMLLRRQMEWEDIPELLWENAKELSKPGVIAAKFVWDKTGGIIVGGLKIGVGTVSIVAFVAVLVGTLVWMGGGCESTEDTSPPAEKGSGDYRTTERGRDSRLE